MSTGEQVVVEVGGIRTEELEREGAQRAYKVHVAADRLDDLKARRLVELGKSVRLPGFRPGKIPHSILEKRYGSKARSEAAQRLAAEAAEEILAKGGLASAIEAVSGTESGDLEFRFTVTHLPDLPALDFTTLAIERLSASPEELEAAGMTEAGASELFRDHLGQQVQDYLDAAYSFPIAPVFVEREFAAIRQLAESQLEEGAGTESMTAELRMIAERRVRLGAVVTELARRFEITVTESEMAQSHYAGETPAQTRNRLVEEKVVHRLIANAKVSDRVISSEELRELAGF
jgi:FKBP-type peptidyl-prolyl cis-trans isomerase (trigger factor)